MGLFDVASGVLNDLSKQPPSAFGLGQSVLRQGYKEGGRAIIRNQMEEEEKEEQRQASHPTNIGLVQDVDGVSMPQGQGSRGKLEPQVVEPQPKNPEPKPEPQPQEKTVGGVKDSDSIVPRDNGAQSSQKAAVSPGPADPVGHLTTSNTNISNGQGDYNGGTKLPPIKDDAQIMGEFLSQQGKQLTLRDIETPNWYEDDSFYEGMLSFGLNLLSGNDWATSFNAGAQVFTDSKALEKRQIWAQDLLAQGYDPLEVDEWIKTGDNKVLTDAEERLAKQLQLASAKQGYINLMRESDPAMLQYKLEEKEEEKQYGRWKDKQELGFKSRAEARADRLAKAELDKTNEEINQLRDPKANWKGRGPDGRPLTGVYEDANGNKTSVIESPEGWVDLGTNEPIDPRQGRVLVEGVAKDLGAQEKESRKTFNAEQTEISDMGANFMQGLEQARDFIKEDLHPVTDIMRIFPRTDEAEKEGRLNQALQGMFVTAYTSIKGVTGAAAKTEERLSESIPSITASYSEKKTWMNRKLNYDISVLGSTIKDMRRKYGDEGIPDSLKDAYKAAVQMKASLNK